jgi:hypothetical protein
MSARVQPFQAARTCGTYICGGNVLSCQHMHELVNNNSITVRCFEPTGCLQHYTAACLAGSWVLLGCCCLLTNHPRCHLKSVQQQHTHHKERLQACKRTPAAKQGLATSTAHRAQHRRALSESEFAQRPSKSSFAPATDIINLLHVALLVSISCVPVYLIYRDQCLVSAITSCWTAPRAMTCT